MKLGFTGTRKGLSLKQYWRLVDWCNHDRPGADSDPITEVHHGACVGADADFVKAVMRNRIGGTDERAWATIHAHPSTLAPLTDRDALALSDVVRPAKPPLDRNADIVAACDVLLAAPEGPETLRSGTWATIRQARKAGKPVVIVWPDGGVTTEGLT